MSDNLQAFVLTFASSGIVIKSTADEIPITAYAKLVNMTTTLENSVRVRYGYSRLESGISGIPHSFSFLRSSGSNYRYAIGSQQLYGAVPGSGYLPVYGGSSMSASQRAHKVTFAFPSPATDTTPHLFYADGTKFIHHSVADTTHPSGSGSYATGNARNVGMPTPTDFSASVPPELATVSVVTIDTLQSTSSWVDETASVSSIISSDGHSAGRDAFNLTVTGKSLVGGTSKISSLNLLAFDKDEIEIWVKWPTANDALCTSEIILSLGFGTGADKFVTRYERTLIPSPLTGALSPDRPVDSTEAAKDALELDDLKTGSDNTKNPPEPLELG